MCVTRERRGIARIIYKCYMNKVRERTSVMALTLSPIIRFIQIEP